MAERSSKPAYAFAADRDWPGYFDAVAGKPARETLLEALMAMELVGLKPAPDRLLRAIDLGCGEGRDTAELLRRGFEVVAIDGHPEALSRLHGREDLRGRGDLRERLTLRLAPLEGVELEPCVLLNVSFTLPFCDPGSFAGLWGRIRASIVPGGFFAGQFFGDRDSWAVLPDRTHHTRTEVEALLDGLEVVRLREDESDATDAGGNPKHWHVFHVVARKPGEVRA